MGVLRAAPTLLIAVVAVFAQSALNTHLRGVDTAWVGPNQDQAARKWDPRIYQILSFGHLPSVIDWKWLEVLVDPSLTRLPRGVHPAIYYQLDLITDLDPGFFEAYYGGSMLLSIIRDDAFGARDLLLKAERFRKERLPQEDSRFAKTHWSGAWWLTLNLAYVHLFELHDMPSAAATFREAAMQSGAPDYLRSLAERLERPGGQHEVGLRLLNFMIGEARDEKVRERLEEQRRSLFVSQYIADLERSFRSYLEHHPRFRSGLNAAQMAAFWESYRKETGLASLDPWGGELAVDVSGKLRTTTPHREVFGLE